MPLAGSDECARNRAGVASFPLLHGLRGGPDAGFRSSTLSSFVMSHPEFNSVAGMAWECAAAHSHAIPATNKIVVRCSFGPRSGPKLHRTTTAEMPCTMRGDRTYTASQRQMCQL